MEPVQRIPRYTLMFRIMLKHIAPNDPQYQALLEADEIASKIAQAEADENTRLARTMIRLQSIIEDFPPGLISNKRRFVDAIDVEDLVDGPGMTPTYGGAVPGANLHCSLLLFHDKLMIVRRSGGERGIVSLAGLDELDKLWGAGAGTHSLGASSKKSAMSCKGVVEVTDVVATDVGGPGTSALC